MKLNEMEKRLIFQADATTKTEITYELRRCLPYITDLEKRQTAANLVRKLDGMAWLVIAFLISPYGLPMLAIRRMNDTLCMEHGLSIVENPKPSRDHYGTWLGEQKQPSHQEQLRWAIDAALAEKPKDFEEFLKMLQASGIEVNRERKHLRLRTSPEHRYAQCDTLKGDYTEQAIKERIAGTRTVTPRRTSYQKPTQKIGMLVDIEAVLYLKEHGDMSYAELREKSDAVTADFNTLSAQIKEPESKMNANAELQKQIVNYAKTQAIYVKYRKAGYSKKFRSAHEADILLHQAAKKYFDELGITKLPSAKGLREEYADLLEQKRKAYSAYKQARTDMKELHNVRANVEYLLEIHTEQTPQHSTEKDRH